MCAASLLLASFCYGQKRISDDLNLEVKTAKGVIVSVDPSSLTILVRRADGEEVSFLVPPQAKIFNDTDLVSFPKLGKDDEVTVKYFVDDVGTARVTSVTITDSIEASTKMSDSAKSL